MLLLPTERRPLLLPKWFYAIQGLYFFSSLILPLVVHLSWDSFFINVHSWLHFHNLCAFIPFLLYSIWLVTDGVMAAFVTGLSYSSPQSTSKSRLNSPRRPVHLVKERKRLSSKALPVKLLRNLLGVLKVRVLVEGQRRFLDSAGIGSGQ
ncbi:hypothetical protein HOY80DRAFT_304631 [Tuber brumale]|nr:hypothetical protein HOY80DRAFT_304631 [Tuber brumale]